ncbi:hypothetical protein HMPREF9061_01081 [Actinomyces sp. oral taxon 181 str. F0379]|nr:hypothetical protein HMPREF9061_01081 [Actinomyces sp. oral taxon 181 str. F0379]
MACAPVMTWRCSSVIISLPVGSTLPLQGARFAPQFLARIMGCWHEKIPFTGAGAFFSVPEAENA